MSISSFLVNDDPNFVNDLGYNGSEMISGFSGTSTGELNSSSVSAFTSPQSISSSSGVSMKTSPASSSVDANLYTASSGYEAFALGDTLSYNMNGANQKNIDPSYYAHQGLMSDLDCTSGNVTMNVDDLFDSAGSGTSAVSSDSYSPLGSNNNDFDYTGCLGQNGLEPNSNRAWEAFSPSTPNSSASSTNTSISGSSNAPTSSNKKDKKTNPNSLLVSSKPVATKTLASKKSANKTANFTGVKGFPKAIKSKPSDPQLMIKVPKATTSMAVAGISIKSPGSQSSSTSGSERISSSSVADLHKIQKADDADLNSEVSSSTLTAESNRNVHRLIFPSNKSGSNSSAATFKIVSGKKDLIKYINVHKAKAAQSARLATKLIAPITPNEVKVKNTVIMSAGSSKTLTAVVTSHPGKPKQTLTRSSRIIDTEINEEEKRLLVKEGYQDFPMTSRQLTKQEEKILRKIRRKIRNKRSAQSSRQRKKEYVEELERQCSDSINMVSYYKKQCILLRKEKVDYLRNLRKFVFNSGDCVSFKTSVVFLFLSFIFLSVPFFANQSQYELDSGNVVGTGRHLLSIGAEDCTNDLTAYNSFYPCYSQPATNSGSLLNEAAISTFTSGTNTFVVYGLRLLNSTFGRLASSISSIF